MNTSSLSRKHMSICVKAIIYLMLLTGLSSCKFLDIKTPDIQDPEAIYKKELIMTDMIPVWKKVQAGTSGEGFLILDRKPSYQLMLYARENPENIRISNCHRDVLLYDQKRQFTYHFEPNENLELDCILQIKFHDSEGRHQFGAIAFKNGETLPAVVQCNGSTDNFVGASVCQSKSGTTEVIEFGVDVRVVKGSGCLADSKDLKKWFLTSKSGFCQYRFVSKTGSEHKHQTFGYDEILKRKN